ncbi:MAG: hypothetical protein R2749_04030 [Acidimicrobiales bacterium]
MIDDGAQVAGWAHAWSGSADDLADAYVADAVVVLVGDDGASAGPGRSVLAGRDAIRTHAAAGLYHVPDRAVAPWRSVTGADPLTGAVHVVTEWLFTGRAAEDLVTMAVPGVTWWRLDAAGLVAEEVRIVAWPRRRILDDEVRGAGRPLADGPERSQRWYRDFVARLTEVSTSIRSWPARQLRRGHRAGRLGAGFAAARRPPAGCAAGRRRGCGRRRAAGTFAVRLDDGDGPAAVVLPISTTTTGPSSSGVTAAPGGRPAPGPGTRPSG